MCVGWWFFLTSHGTWKVEKMTIQRARKLLGKESEGLSDEQIINIINQMKAFTDVVANIIDKRIINLSELSSDDKSSNSSQSL